MVTEGSNSKCSISVGSASMATQVTDFLCLRGSCLTEVPPGFAIPPSEPLSHAAAHIDNSRQLLVGMDVMHEIEYAQIVFFYTCDYDGCYIAGLLRQDDELWAAWHIFRKMCFRGLEWKSLGSLCWALAVRE